MRRDRSPERPRLSPSATIAAARALRASMTPTETILWEALRRQQIPGHRFRRQHPLGGFVVDFYCPRCRLAIEVDGSVHDGAAERDAERQQMIEGKYLVRFLRVTADEVDNALESVLDRIRHTD